MVELFREHDLLGLPFEEQYGGTGTGALMVLVAVEELSKVCATTGLIMAVQELGSLGHQARRDGRAEGALPAAARERRVARGLRADRAGLGLGLGGDAHRSAARRRRVRPQRRQALHHERGRRGALRRLREDRSGGRPLGDLRVRRRGRHARLRGRADRAEDGHQGLDDRRDLLQRHARSRPTTCSARRATASRSRCGSSTARGRASPRRGSGSRRARPTTRSSTRSTRETMGKPIAQHQLIAGDARRHGDEVRGRARAALQDRADDRRGRAGRRADEDLGDGEAVLHGRGDGGHDRRGADPRRLRLHAGVPGRAHDARREDHADLRGHEPDPASRDRPRNAQREPRLLARWREAPLTA